MAVNLIVIHKVLILHLIYLNILCDTIQYITH